MDAHEVVVHVEQGDRVSMVFNLLAERVGQARKAAHVHTHRQVLPFDVGRADVLRVRRPGDVLGNAAKALGRAVAGFSVRGRTVNLIQHRVVDVAAERILDGSEIHPVAIRRQLDAVRQTIRHIAQKVSGATRIAQADEPRQDQLALRLDGHERPDVADLAVGGAFRGDLLLLAAHKRPDFINLDAAGTHVADRVVLIPCAGRTDIGQQPQDGALRHASQARRGAHRATLDQRRDDRHPLGHWQPVHVLKHKLIRFSMSSEKEGLGCGFLLFLRPAGFGSLNGHVVPFLCRHGFQTALAADFAALPAHFGHDLRYERLSRRWRRVSRFSLSDGLEHHAAGILDSIKALASALRHRPQSHGAYGFVKREGISN